MLQVIWCFLERKAAILHSPWFVDKVTPILNNLPTLVFMYVATLELKTGHLVSYYQF